MDSLLFFWLGDIITQSQKIVLTPGQTVNIHALLIHLLVSVLWFILSVGFLLTIRRPYKSVGWFYFRNGFFVYVKLALVFSFIFLLGINFLASFGITMFPSFHWAINLLIRLVEIITIFYWFDSACFFKDIFLSLERALNFVLYNAPFFLFLFGVWFALKTGVDLLVTMSGFDLAQISQRFNGIKYLLFFWDYFCIALIFSFYGVKKRERYNRSLFVPKRS